MKLSKQRTVYVALLGLGLAALAVDKLMLAPASAEASPEPAPEAAPAPQAAAPAPAPAPKSSGPFLASRVVVAARGGSGGRDAFRAATDWVRPVEQQGAPASENPAAPGIAEFKAKHSLWMIGSAPKEKGGDPLPAAFVNGKALHVGDVIGGFELSIIDERARRAVFRSASGEVELCIPGPGAADERLKVTPTEPAPR